MARWIGDQSKEALRRRDIEACGGAFTCTYCGCELHAKAHNSDLQAGSLDHLLPRSKGGAIRSWDNLVGCCASCNSRRQDTDLSVWLAAHPNRAEIEADIARRLALSTDRKRYMAEARAMGLYDNGSDKAKALAAAARRASK